ncbi:MAG: hypothetical protein K2H83_06585 [Duncaniella sp.]|nr:hypothetical protein [Duncaniella sp.]
MKTDNEYRRLAALAMEVEGLLLLLESRSGEDTSMVLELLGEKAAMLQGGIMALPCPCRQAEAEIENKTACEAKAEAAKVEEKAEEKAEAVKAQEEKKAEASVASEACETQEASVTPVLRPTVGEALETPETLDERIARERARDIKKAFTINDKFRFRRELFHDSQEEFDETLDIISGMASFGEAEEYFYDDLCWNPSDTEVMAFMETVSRHF